MYNVYVLNMNEAHGELITSSPITYKEALQVKRNVSANLYHEYFVQIVEVEEDERDYS